MRFGLAFCLLAAAQLVAGSASAASAHLCVDGSDHKTIRDGACNADEHEVTTESPAPNQGREGQGSVDVTHMPRVYVEPSAPEARNHSQYDKCAHVSVPECDEYPSLSSEWSNCRRSTWDWIHQQCVALDSNANFEQGEKRRCMKARARAYCVLEDRYEIVRHH
jgi:hypothetical protein